MTKLQSEALAREVLSRTMVESFYDRSRSGIAEQCLIDDLCRSHERLRMELEGATAIQQQAASAATGRTVQHIREHPLPGDVIEVADNDGESMVRVVAVHEDRVWCKTYGPIGHRLIPLDQWRDWLNSVRWGKVIRPADADCPF